MQSDSERSKLPGLRGALCRRLGVRAGSGGSGGGKTSGEGCKSIKPRLETAKVAMQGDHCLGGRVPRSSGEGGSEWGRKGVGDAVQQ
jgi:hypothetical protein